MGYITFELGSKIWHLETNKKAVIDLIIKLIKYVNDSVGDSTTFEAGHRWRQASKNNAILVFLPGKNQYLACSSHGISITRQQLIFNLPIL